MIVNRGKGREIIVRYRDNEGNRVQKKLGNEINPYCFIRDSDINKVNGYVKSEGGFKGVYGESLTKLIFNTPNEVSKLHKESGVQTWEGNI